MISVSVEFVCTVKGTRKELESQAWDRVMDALLDLEACNSRMHSPALSLDLGKQEITFEFSYEAETLEEAQAESSALVRSAIHTAGGSTPNWTETDETDGLDFEAADVRYAVA